MTFSILNTHFKLLILTTALGLAFYNMTAVADTNATGVELTIQDDTNISPLRSTNTLENITDSKATDSAFVFNPNSAGSAGNPVVVNDKSGGVKSKDANDKDTDVKDVNAKSIDAKNLNTKDDKNKETPENVVEIRQRIIDGYAMQNVASTRTSEHEAWYAKRPDYIKRMMERSQKYLYFIVGEVEKRGMPTEIALLPMIESAFNPQAYSTSRAAGIWQFIPSTGKDFGLEQNFWKDNRRNVTAATGAALNYLQKLHGMFGSWELALAAYNAGEGTVQRAINRNKKLGLPTDYASLNLPAETQHYVPKLQAIKNIMTNPQEFGLDIAPINNTPYFAKVTAPDRIDAKLAASLAGITMEEFNALNPEHKRPILGFAAGTHDILLPINSVATFNTNLSGYTKPLVSWQTYQAKRGENIGQVAQKFGMNVGELREVNQLSSKTKLKNNMPLLVSNNDGADNIEPNNANFNDNFESVSAEQPSVNQSNALHVVKKRETLNTIAKKYGVTVTALKSENNIKINKLKLGQRLEIPAKKTTLTRNTRTNTTNSTRNYLVKRGDTLAEIAVKFDVTSAEIKRWNKLKNSTLKPGRKLIIVRS